MNTVVLALAALACPVGMGVMMWFMSKGMRRGHASAPALRGTSVADLRAEQQRLAAEMGQLDRSKAEDTARLAATRS